MTLDGAARLGVIPCDDGVILSFEVYVPLDRAETAALAARLDGAVLSTIFAGAPPKKARGGGLAGRIEAR